MYVFLGHHCCQLCCIVHTPKTPYCVCKIHPLHPCVCSMQAREEVLLLKSNIILMKISKSAIANDWCVTDFHQIHFIHLQMFKGTTC